MNDLVDQLMKNKNGLQNTISHKRPNRNNWIANSKH